MYPPGHVGITVLLFSPLASLLVAAGRERVAVGWLSVALALTLVPDLDLLLPVLGHRGITHTIPFAVGLGSGVAALAWTSSRSALGSGIERVATGFLVGAGAVGSHLLGDVITPMGIQLLFPVGREVYTLELVYARSPAANAAFLVVGVVVCAVVAHRARTARPGDADDGEDAESGLPAAG